LTMSVQIYVGGPGTGKTFAAIAAVVERGRETGKPILVIDSCGAENFDGLFSDPPMNDVVAAVEALYTQGQHVHFLPESEEDVARLVRKIRAGGNVIVLIDEASFWISGLSAPEELNRLVRTYRHSRVDVYATTQYLGDFPRWYLNCVTEAIVFRNTDDRALERIEKAWGLSPADVARLPDRSFIRWRYDAPRSNNPAPSATPDGVEGTAREAGIHTGEVADRVDSPPVEGDQAGEVKG
jgi:hypothetical protein